jgi:hypothetical protein
MILCNRASRQIEPYDGYPTTTVYLTQIEPYDGYPTTTVYLMLKPLHHAVQLLLIPPGRSLST